MIEILRVLGNQSAENQSFISEEQFLSYVDQLQEAQTFGSGTFDNLFKHASEEMRQLLRGMLEFNPHFRLTAKEALNSEIFDNIRSK
jgi:serine/threonine protein kinase